MGLLTGLAAFAIAVWLTLALAKAFNKSTAFAIFGLMLFPFVGYPMLAFGSAQYQGNSKENQPREVPPAYTPPQPPATGPNPPAAVPPAGPSTPPSVPPAPPVPPTQLGA